MHGWGGVQNKVVGRIAQHGFDPQQHVLHGHRQLGQLGVIHQGKVVAVTLGVEAQLEGRAGGVGGQRHEVGELLHHADPFVQLKIDQIAEDTAFLVVEVVAGHLELGSGHRRQQRHGDQLAVGMVQGRPGTDAVVLEEHHVAKTEILAQIEIAVTIGDQDIGDLAGASDRPAYGHDQGFR